MEPVTAAAYIGLVYFALCALACVAAFIAGWRLRARSDAKKRERQERAHAAYTAALLAVRPQVYTRNDEGRMVPSTLTGKRAYAVLYDEVGSQPCQQ